MKTTLSLVALFGVMSAANAALLVDLPMTSTLSTSTKLISGGTSQINWTTGSETLVTGPTGAANSAVHFNYTTTSWSAAASTSFSLDQLYTTTTAATTTTTARTLASGSAFSMASWVKSDAALASTGFATILSTDGEGGFKFGIYMEGSTYYLRLTTKGVLDRGVALSSSFDPTAWNHVAVTLSSTADGTASLLFYLNGVKAGQVDVASGFTVKVNSGRPTEVGHCYQQIRLYERSSQGFTELCKGL